VEETEESVDIEVVGLLLEEEGKRRRCPWDAASTAA
jgi:hypothetical protein